MAMTLACAQNRASTAIKTGAAMAATFLPSRAGAAAIGSKPSGIVAAVRRRMPRHPPIPALPGGLPR